MISGLKNIGNSILGKFGMSLDNFKLNQNENGSYNVSYNNWIIFQILEHKAKK